jgi:hypothetical protein
MDVAPVSYPGSHADSKAALCWQADVRAKQAAEKVA